MNSTNRSMLNHKRARKMWQQVSRGRTLRIRISNLKWPYFFLCSSKRLTVIYFFAQNFILFPMVLFISFEFDFWKTSIFYPFFGLTVLPVNVSLWPIKTFARPNTRAPSQKSLQYLSTFERTTCSCVPWKMSRILRVGPLLGWQKWGVVSEHRTAKIHLSNW